MKRLIGLFVLVLALSVGAIGVLAQEATPEPTTPTNPAEDMPFLGVNYDTNGDAVVIRVMRGTPAADAGLLDGDIILAVNESAVTGATMTDAIIAFVPGDVITLSVQRGEETLDIEVTLGSRAGYDNRRSPGHQGGNGHGMFELQMMGDRLALNADGNIEVVDAPEGSILAEAGLQAGDVITAINGNAIMDGSFPPNLRDGIDGTLTLTVERDGESLDIEISAAELPMMLFGMMQGMRGDMPFDFQMPDGAFGGGRDNMQPGQARNRVILGVQYVPLTEDNAADFSTDLTAGAYIVSVVAGSPAEAAGLQAGDVVTALDGTALDDTHNLADIVRGLEPDATLTLTVVRDGETLELTVHLGVLNADTPIETSIG